MPKNINKKNRERVIGTQTQPKSHVQTQLPPTHYLGCDVAKAKIDVSLINANGIELLTAVVPNTVQDLTGFLLTLRAAYLESDDRSILSGVSRLECVVEATSTYHYALLEASRLADNTACRVYNPIITKSGIRATVRGKKTDRTDALLVARMGLRGEGRIHTPETHMTTKHYARGAQKLSVLGSSFKQYKTHLTELLDSSMTDEATELLLGIQTSIKAAKAQIYKDLYASARGDIFTRLQTITGVGPFVAASLLGEIQDMSRFMSDKALIAYTGLDPKIRQSGKSLNSTGRLTKRGSSYLRRSVFIAASVGRIYDPQLRALYDKKRTEGKTYKEATCVVARKMLRIIRSVWLSGEDYVVPENAAVEVERTEKRG